MCDARGQVADVDVGELRDPHAVVARIEPVDRTSCSETRGGTGAAMRALWASRSGLAMPTTRQRVGRGSRALHRRAFAWQHWDTWLSRLPWPSDARVPCPLCGGLIHPIAGRCKHCKADLADAPRRAPAAAARPARRWQDRRRSPPTRPTRAGAGAPRRAGRAAGRCRTTARSRSCRRARPAACRRRAPLAAAQLAGDRHRPRGDRDRRRGRADGVAAVTTRRPTRTLPPPPAPERMDTESAAAAGRARPRRRRRAGQRAPAADPWATAGSRRSRRHIDPPRPDSHEPAESDRRTTPVSAAPSSTPRQFGGVFQHAMPAHPRAGNVAARIDCAR